MAEAVMTNELQKEQFNNLVQQTLQNEEESAKTLFFLQNISTIEKKLKLKPYTTTRIKAARNFLSNIAYNSVNDQDIFNRNVCLDIYALVIKKSQSVFFDQSKCNH